jgi:hypothetical protein
MRGPLRKKRIKRKKGPPPRGGQGLITLNTLFTHLRQQQVSRHLEVFKDVVAAYEPVAAPSSPARNNVLASSAPLVPPPKSARNSWLTAIRAGRCDDKRSHCKRGGMCEIGRLIGGQTATYFVSFVFFAPASAAMSFHWTIIQAAVLPSEQWLRCAVVGETTGGRHHWRRETRHIEEAMRKKRIKRKKGPPPRGEQGLITLNTLFTHRRRGI